MKIPLIVIGVIFVIFGVISVGNGFTLGLLMWGGLGIIMILASGVGKDAKKAVDKKVVEIKKTEEELYGQISEELENNKIDKSLWTKAEAESDGGDDKKVKSIYIKLRYEKLTRDTLNLS
jgi:hypothetical protein